MQSLGNPGNTYGHCHASEDAPAISARRHKCGAARLCGGSNSLAASYVAVAMFGLGAFMINAAYWVLSSLTTSFNAQLGSFSLAALYIAFIVSLLLAPSLVAILGSKTCSVLSGLCTLVFTASYFYPSWYTIMPSSVVQGFGYSLMYTTISITKNDEVRRVVEKLNVDEVTYQGRFTAVIIFACNSAGIVAGFISVATLSGGNDHTSSSCTYLFDNITHNTSGQTGVTVTLSTAAATAADTSTNYYILVAVCTALAFLSVVTFSITRAAAYHQCRVHSFGLREALRKITKHSADVFKQAITPAYAPVLPLRILQGLVGAYFFGVFTKVSYDVHAHTHARTNTLYTLQLQMYITECVGVGFVGVFVIVWGLFSGMGSFSTGWLMRYTASYVVVALTIGLGQMGAIVFLIAWVRQPSFAAIIIVSAVCGLCYGVNSATALGKLIYIHFMCSCTF